MRINVPFPGENALPPTADTQTRNIAIAEYFLKQRGKGGAAVIELAADILTAHPSLKMSPKKLMNTLDTGPFALGKKNSLYSTGRAINIGRDKERAGKSIIWVHADYCHNLDVIEASEAARFRGLKNRLKTLTTPRTDAIAEVEGLLAEFKEWEPSER